MNIKKTTKLIEEIYEVIEQEPAMDIQLAALNAVLSVKQYQYSNEQATAVLAQSLFKEGGSATN